MSTTPKCPHCGRQHKPNRLTKPVKHRFDAILVRSALFDDPVERTYRYSLRRIWAPTRSVCVFLMCNPSAADEDAEDKTVCRALDFAEASGHGELIVVNAFAYRGTDPDALYCAGIDPVGPDNDRYILAAHAEGAMTVVGWGANGSSVRLANRQEALLDLLEATGKGVYFLKMNLDGSPMHPLYVAGDTCPRLYGRTVRPCPPCFRRAKAKQPHVPCEVCHNTGTISR